MVDFNLVTSMIEARFGMPFLANMEDGYVTWLSKDRQYALTFCNWDVCGNDVDSQCELRIDHYASQEIAERTVLNGFDGNALYEATASMLDVAVDRYGF